MISVGASGEAGWEDMAVVHPRIGTLALVQAEHSEC